jgi:hypothetical protein
MNLPATHCHDFNHRPDTGATHFAPPPTGLDSSARHLLHRIVAGQANALDKDNGDRLLESNLDARDFFFKLLLKDAPFNQ